MITLNIELTREDYFKFYYYTVWLAPGKKAAAIKSRVKTFALFVLAFTLIQFAVSPHDFNFFFFYTLLVLASIYVLPLFSIESSCRKQSDAFCNDPLNANFFLRSEMIISETGIFDKASHAEVNYRWNGIIKKVETAEHFLLYISGSQAIIIPKRAIRSDAERTALLELFGKHISFDAEVGHLVKE